MNAKAVLVLVLIAFLLLVVVGALLSSVPVYLTGAAGAILTYFVACICTDVHNLER